MRWADGETPAVIYSTFWSIINCGKSAFSAPNGEIFKCSQLVANACTWLHDGSVFKVDFAARRAAGPQSQLRLYDKDGFFFFDSISMQCPLEGWVYGNNQNACILMYAGAQGFGSIWWNDRITELINGFGLTPGRSLFLELFKAGGVNNVYKFCDLYERTNIKILAQR